MNRKHEYPGLASGTKVLVTTGGTIADATISQLSAAGCLVTTLSLLEATKGGEGALIPPESCARAVEDQEVVVHAGRMADRFSSAVDACGHVTAGTRLLLEAAAASGSVKAFVFASSARCDQCCVSLSLRVCTLCTLCTLCLLFLPSRPVPYLWLRFRKDKCACNY